MGRALRGTLIAGASAAFAVAAACTSFGTTTSDAPPDAAAEAATDAADSSNDGCTSLVDDDFEDTSVSSAKWQFFGAAKVEGGRAVLVPESPGQVGLMWIEPATPIGAGELHIVADTYVDSAGTPADALTFVWSAAKPLHQGQPGSDIGLCNADPQNDALGVSLESNDHQIELGDFRGPNCDRDGPEAGVVGTHHLEVRVRGDEVRATLDGVDVIKTNAGRTFPIAAVGFVAATGGNRAKQGIDNVHIVLCP